MGKLKILALTLPVHNSGKEELIPRTKVCQIFLSFSVSQVSSAKTLLILSEFLKFPQPRVVNSF